MKWMLVNDPVNSSSTVSFTMDAFGVLKIKLPLMEMKWKMVQLCQIQELDINIRNNTFKHTIYDVYCFHPLVISATVLIKQYLPI